MRCEVLLPHIFFCERSLSTSHKNIPIKMNVHPSALPPPSMITSSGFAGVKERRAPPAVDDAKSSKLYTFAANDYWNTKRTEDQEILLRLRRMNRRLFLSLAEANNEETGKNGRSTSRPVVLQNTENEIPTKSSPVHLAALHRKVRFCDITDTKYFQQPETSYPKSFLKVPSRKNKLRFVAYHPLPGRKPPEETQPIPELELGQTFDVDCPMYVSSKPKFDTDEHANCFTDRTNTYKQ